MKPAIHRLPAEARKEAVIRVKREAYKRNRRCLLDTSFILSAIRNKIDFFEELELEGIKILIPEQVIAEIKRISQKKQEAKLALKIIQKNKFKKINLKQNNVDKGIKKLAKQKPDIAIATLDRELKKLKNKKLVIRGKKKLEIIN